MNQPRPHHTVRFGDRAGIYTRGTAAGVTYRTSSDWCFKPADLHTRTARTLTWLAWRTPIRTTRHARFLIALASIHELIYHHQP